MLFRSIHDKYRRIQPRYRADWLAHKSLCLPNKALKHTDLQPVIQLRGQSPHHSLFLRPDVLLLPQILNQHQHQHHYRMLENKATTIIWLDSTPHRRRSGLRFYLHNRHEFPRQLHAHNRVCLPPMQRNCSGTTPWKVHPLEVHHWGDRNLYIN